MSCGINTEVDQLMEQLAGSFDSTLPPFNPDDDAWKLPGGQDSDIYKPTEPVTNEALTEKKVDGKGTFDIVSSSIAAHLEGEFNAGRISGGEYTKAYIALMEAALGNSVQFLLQRDQAKWQALNAQIAAITARLQMEEMKNRVMLSRIQVQNASVEHALLKTRLATEGNNYCIGKFNLEQMLPQQLSLTKEQTEAARAQTMNTRTDGSTVAGSVGKQTALYDQQITSYKRNDEYRFTNMLTNTWVAQKTIDEDLLAPANMQNAAIDAVLASTKANLGI